MLKSQERVKEAEGGQQGPQGVLQGGMGAAGEHSNRRTLLPPRFLQGMAVGPPGRVDSGHKTSGLPRRNR